jgi:cell division protein FtsQ
LRRGDTTRGNGEALLDYPELDRLEDDFYRPDESSPVEGKRQRVAGKSARAAVPDADGDAADDDAPFLRSRRRVPVRRGPIPQSVAGRVALGVGVVLALGAAAFAVYTTQNFLRHDPRFRIASSASIRIVGNSEVSRPELLAIFGEDIGRNIFYVPLEERRKQMETLPWIAHATVMRLLPDQLRIAVTERTPVAFVQNGNRAGLVDAEGVLLEMPQHSAQKHYSFPVITGINADDPPSTRAARMKIYARFVHDLDAGGENVSSKLSEVDLSEPEDVRAVIPDGDRSLLIHFGDENFLERYHGYQAHLADWRQQYPHLAAVDARYDTQFVLQMDQDKDAAAVSAVSAPAPPAPATAAMRTATPATRTAVAPRPGAGHAVARAVAAHPRSPKKPVKAAAKTAKPKPPARQETLQELRQRKHMEQK